MELNFLTRLLFLFLLLSVLSSFSSSSFISDGVFVESHALVTGRNLLQVPKDCPVSFEFKNYTIITSKCKGPKYPPKECCAAFKEFACPYHDLINDPSTKCADTMFSYIYIYGKYPPGLFANECKEGKQGLACPDSPPANAAATTSSSPSLWVTVSVASTALVNLF